MYPFFMTGRWKPSQSWPEAGPMATVSQLNLRKILDGTRTNNAIERLNREIRRRTRVVGTFPDGRSALMLVTARLKYIAECEWGKRCF